MGTGNSLAALADRFGVAHTVAEQVDALGLLPREADGSLGGAAARRLQMFGFARSRGIPDERLLEAMRCYGDLFVSFDGLGLTPAEHDDQRVYARELGLDDGLAEQIAVAGGRQIGEPLTEEDVQALRTAKQALDLGLPADVLLQLTRVFADNMQRLAEAENKIFHDHVHEQFRAEGLTGRELMEATAGISNGLLALVEPTVLYFHRRAWAAAAQHDFIRHLTEDDRPVQTAPGAAACVVMFADLSGFTPLTAAMGDQAAAEVLTRFGSAVRRITTQHNGRVIKQIGDAFMLVFDDRRDAILGGVALLTWCMHEPRFPALHVGAHAGEVLFHDGDYVGSAVNLAARVAAVTEPSQFVVTDDVLAALELPDGVVAQPLGSRALKGLHEPVRLTSVAAELDAKPEWLQDPVCGMSVAVGAITRTWNGTDWPFCSPRCADAFEAEPTRYLTGADELHDSWRL